VFKEGNTIFLLFPRCVDVHKEQRDVVMADQHHNAGVIETFHGGLLFITVCCFIQHFTLVNCFIRNCSVPLLRWLLTRSFNPPSDFIHLSFGDEIHRIVKWRTGTCQASMTMVKVPISSDMNITTSAQWLPKRVA